MSSCIQVPKVYQTISDRNFGVNDVVYSPTDSLLLEVAEDTDVLGRLDSKISSIRMPWDDEPSKPLPLGSLSCFVHDLKSDSWQPAASVYFQHGASTIAWDSGRRYAYVGLDNGTIVAYYANSTCKELSLAHEYPLHKDRVAGLIHVPQRDVLISIGRDSLLSVYSLVRGETISSAQVGSAWLASVQVDLANDHVFIGTFDNQLYVYDIGTPVSKKG